MTAGNNHTDEAEDELLQFIGGFDGECPTTQDFCDDIDFDLLTPPASPFFGMAAAHHGVFNDDSESMQRSSNSGGAAKYEKEEVVASLLSGGSLFSEDSCFAALLSSTPEVNQKGEGQGDNFIAGSKKVQQMAPKKRKRESCPDVADAELDATAKRLETDLKKLEQENKKLVSCFLTLGEQMKSMMAENVQLRGVLNSFNGTASGIDSKKSSKTQAERKSEKSSTISPTVQLLAQVAMLSGKLKK